MARSLDMRLRVLEHHGDGSARADGLDALAAWVAGARGRVGKPTDDDLWAFVLGLDELQLQNMRIVAAAYPESISGKLAAGGFLGDATQHEG